MRALLVRGGHWMTIATPIAPCMACGLTTRLYAGACPRCLAARERTPRWDELAWRCRNDPAFASEIYTRLDATRGHVLFRAMFGDRSATDDMS